MRGGSADCEAVAAGVAPATAPAEQASEPRPDLEERVARLERELAELRERLG